MKNVLAMNLLELGEFLKAHRARVRPADVGLPAGPRRRVPGLRRDEVARLADMSVDYYIELEQGRGQCPSLSILAGLVRALRLSRDEETHLAHLAGHAVPLGAESSRMQHAVLRLMDRLDDTPAMVISVLHQILVQNALARALIGPFPTGHEPEANFVFQWFADPAVRRLFPSEERTAQSRVLVHDLRAAVARRGHDTASAELLRRLHRFDGFTELWDAREIALPHEEHKQIVHPALGLIDVSRNSFYTADCTQRLLWLVPHNPSVLDELRLLDTGIVWQRGRPSPVTGTHAAHRRSAADGRHGTHRSLESRPVEP
ncbi:helix-turn-helix transcriptional regulator [Streptomyces sp. PSKA30]|uniref:helix-turn-helix transcriptional regulator n=1 Tax=Streptomyces sp. PSKA30 TaxID=2874597 RepID=UPI001CD11AC2|nr:helix-turn-helix transcriptional regulator [Streptomyces sp. PSKA30]MBZ9645678.1 helix-turn-helix transcriptional regulator [Streptomyces sp. PSKA30]